MRMAKKGKVKRRCAHTLRDELAEQIKRHFTVAYRRKYAAMRGVTRWTPGYAWRGVWAKTAELVMQHRLPVLQYVHYVVFEHNALTMPRPNWLNSESVVKAFRKWQQTQEEVGQREIQIALETELTILEREVGWLQMAVAHGRLRMREEAIKQCVLVSGANRLSPLFRYCCAAAEGLDEIRKRYFRAAVVQYMPEADNYDAVYGSLLPQRFREKARKLYGEDTGR